jgi:hypothetical protein
MLPLLAMGTECSRCCVSLRCSAVRVELVLLMVQYRNREVDLKPMLVDSRRRPCSAVSVSVRVDLVLLII